MLKKNLPLTLIFLVVFVDLLGFGLLMPILPGFAQTKLHVDEFAIGAAIALYSFAQFIFNPILGSLSDRIGRRKVILGTLILNAAGYIIFAFTDTYLILLASRVIAGIGGSSIGVAQAYISDVTTKENRIKGMGLIGVAFGLGFTLGPLMGGILSGFGYQITGFASAAFSCIAFGLSFFFLPESLTTEKRGAIPSRKLLDVAATKRVFSHIPTAVLMILFFTLTFSVANIYGTFTLLAYEIYKMTDLQVGLVFASLGLSGVFVQGYLVGKVSKIFSSQQLILYGALSLALGLLLIPYSVNFTGVLIVTVVLSLGSGVLQPTILSLVSKIASESEQGLVLGVNQSLSAFARMLGPLWGGFAFEYLGYEMPFLTGSFFSVLIALFAFFYLSKMLTLSNRNN